MAKVTFGNFRVNMDNPDFLDEALGTYFDGNAGMPQLIGGTVMRIPFDSGGTLEFDGSFPLGISLGSSLTGVRFLDPGFVNLFSGAATLHVQADVAAILS